MVVSHLFSFAVVACFWTRDGGEVSSVRGRAVLFAWRHILVRGGRGYYSRTDADRSGWGAEKNGGGRAATNAPLRVGAMANLGCRGAHSIRATRSPWTSEPGYRARANPSITGEMKTQATVEVHWLFFLPSEGGCLTSSIPRPKTDFESN